MNVATDMVGETVEYVLPSEEKGHGMVRAVAYDQTREQYGGFIFLILTTEGKLLRATMEQVKLLKDSGVARQVGEALNEVSV